MRWFSGTPWRPVVTAAATVAVMALVMALALVAPAAAEPRPGAPGGASGGAPGGAPIELPSTAAGRQLAWVIEASGRVPVPEAEQRQHLSAPFLDAVGGPAAFNQALASAGPLTVRQVLRSEPARIEALTSGATQTFHADLRTDAAGLVAGLGFGPWAESPSGWAALDARLRALAPQVSFATAEVEASGRCRTVHSVNGTASRPLGSVVKLYVLGALGAAVAEGHAAWNEPLAIRDEWKSLPTGVLQDAPAGAGYPLSRYADLMISISDNTATDHLIHRLGRQAVQRQLGHFGHVDPRVNSPLLTTREFFTLKGAAYPVLATGYLALPRGLRPLLLPAVNRIPLARVEPWTEPRKIDRIEWFGSVADVCRAYAGLWRQHSQPGLAPIGAALSINDGGIGLARAEFPEVWFKGGSEPGVLALTYLARANDGRTYVSSLTLADPNHAIDQAAVIAEAFALIRGGFALAGARR